MSKKIENCRPDQKTLKKSNKIIKTLAKNGNLQYNFNILSSNNYLFKNFYSKGDFKKCYQLQKVWPCTD